MNDADRFWKKVSKSADCWLWVGAKNNQGYGDFHQGGGSRHVLAHRFSFELTNGPIPSGMVVMHKCDFPACVNPGHLRLGTRAENQRDMALKGRAGHRGERSPGAKLTDANVAFIRTSTLRVSDIAKNMRVSRSLVHAVRAGKRWKHVK